VGTTIRLLGPVDVLVNGAARPVRGVRRQAILAVLGLNRGDVVSTDHIVEAVWDGSAPATAMNTLQRNISHLRDLLGDRDAIRFQPPGYLLTPGGEPTDAETAEDLVRQARASGDDQDRVRVLTAALALWRGPSLAGLTELPWLYRQAEQLEDLRRRIVDALADARLALGEHAQLLPELELLAAENRFDERRQGRLILALYRAGRQAEALAVYQRLTVVLRDELGIDPGPELRELYTAVLRQDGALVATAARPAGPTAPAQLPAVVNGFAGRVGELAALDAALASAAGSDRAPLICAVSGGAGVGKTSLAVQWAHLNAGRFPDGQLYVNLRGFDRTGSVMDPAEAVRGFLGALAVPVARVPVGLDAQAALYRSLLAGRRMLVLLDNARDAEQVRPLLPATPGCLTVVTSRHQLGPLVAVEGARPLPVDLLTTGEAEELLVLRVGAQRVAAEPEAVQQIISRCARLPLALSIAAAHAILRPHRPLAALAAELGVGSELDTLSTGDPGSDVRHVFSWSYGTLTAAAARLFRLLGLHPGPDIGAGAMAGLAGLPARAAASLADELVRANLLSERSVGRYVLHDLLRAYAAEQAGRHDSDDERRAASERIFDHYLHTAQSAVRALHGSWCDLALPPPVTGAAPAQLTDTDAAAAWLEAEHEVLLAAIVQAADGFEGYAWRLAWTLSLVLDSRGYWREYAETQRIVLAAALRIDDPVGLAHARHGLGRAYTCLGRDDEAAAELGTALAAYLAIGDRAGAGDVHLGLGFLFDRKGDNAAAMHESEVALELFRSAGHRSGEAMSLSNIGWSLTLQGEYARALPFCERGLALHRELGDPRGQAGSWHSLGLVRQHLGQGRAAVTCYNQGLVLSRQVGDRYLQAAMLHGTGDVLAADGELSSARESWRQALVLLDELGHDEAEEVRYKLRHG